MTLLPSVSATAASLVPPPFTGGGAMARLLAEHDWEHHPLGPADTWPQSLRSALRLMLGSRYPMFLGWGPELYFFYNDAYIPVLGARHPRGLGQRMADLWPELWPVLGPLTESVLRRGEATWNEQLPLMMERNGFTEETYFTFSYSPAPHDDGRTYGVFCACMDETARVLSARRLGLLHGLASAFAPLRDESELLAASARQLDGHPDLPFCLVYLFNGDTGIARLASAPGIAASEAFAPAALRADDQQGPWPIHRLLQSDAAPIEIDLSQHPGLGAAVGSRLPVSRARVVPLTAQGQTQLIGFLVAGLNPFVLPDAAYASFLELLAAQIAAGLASARAYATERQRAEALAQLDRAKTEFFNNVSHEFRTPLTLMLGPLEEELRERPGDRSRLETAHRNSLRLLKLVNTLLDFSRIEAGRAYATYEPTDLAALTVELASAFRSVIENAGLKFVVDCPPLPAPVHVDREMWEQVVLNLLSNAFKFTLAGGITLALTSDGDDVVLTVRDTGSGIPATELPRIFDRFHRVEGTPSRSCEGTGIGLALVQQLVRLHGGDVRASSTEGKGSTFEVHLRMGVGHLPVGHAGAVRETRRGSARASAFLEEAAQWLRDGAEPEPAAASGSTRARILVVDDNRDMREYLRRLLAHHHDVMVAEDGAIALDLARTQPPDLILTDVMMPRLDGFQLLSALRGDPATRTVPLIILSARAGEEARVEGMQYGADDYLVKPFSARELLARVQTHLQLARLRREAAAQVKETEDRFRHVADHSPTMFWVTEANGSCVYLNERWYEYTGQARDEALDAGWLKAVHPADYAAAEGAWQQAARTQREFRIEYRLRRHDGVYRWMLDSGAPRVRDGCFVGFVGSVIDITETREELNALEYSRTQMRLALEAARSGTFDWDIASGRVTWSPELEALYGMPPGSFASTYRAWGQRVVPEDLTAVEAVFQHCFERREENAEFEFRAVMPDGTHRWLEGKARFLYTADGKPRRMTGINLDVDDRKRAALNLQFIDRLSQEIAFISNADEIAHTAASELGRHLDVQRCYFFVPAAGGARVLIERDWVRDRSVESAAGLYPFSHFGEGDLWAAVTGQRTAVGQVDVDPLSRPRLENFRALHISAWATAPFIRDARWVASLAVTSDSPRRWREDELTLLETVLARVWPLVERARTEAAISTAERKIAESEERLRVTMAAGRLGTWDVNPQTRAIEFDDRCKELFDLPADAPVTEPTFLARLHPDDAPKVTAAVGRALDPQSGGNYEVEIRVPTQPGAERWVRSSGQVFFDDAGQPVRFIGTAFDITELVQARETLAERRVQLERLVDERTARLQETVAELEGFSYSISHDLRAPLRAMQSFAQLLEEECGEQISADGRDYLRRIITASDRMDRLIHDVLVYSRVARTELHLGPVDLEPLIDGILESYPQFLPSAATIRIQRPLPCVLGNQAALTQCLSNLLGNAVKFVHSGTRPQVEMWAEADSAMVRLFVRDNGIGIPAEAQEKIFGIFERLSRDFEGTGIGLAVVRKAAERMGGRVSVRSLPGEGCTFCLELPACP